MYSKHLAALAACAALLLAAGSAAAADKEKEAKKPLGTWKRTENDLTVVITVTEKSASVKVKSDKLDLEFEADYALSKGVFFACIRKVKVGDEKLAGELFGFTFEAGESELEMSKFKGTGLVALGGFFMNGKYKKQESKKD
jgi:hypothetical protein